MKRTLRKRIQSGFTLIELLVTIVVSSIVILGVSSVYFNSVKNYHDRRIKSEADEQARALLDLLAFYIRNAGGGLPDLTSFQMGTPGIPIFPYPLAISGTIDWFILQIAPTGKYTVITADVNSSLGSWSADVLDVSTFAAGKAVYISGLTAGTEEGCLAIISSISGNTLTFDANALCSGGAASFKDGSSVTQVDFYDISSQSNWNGILLNDGTGYVNLAPNSTFAARYLDTNGNTVALTYAKIENQLTTIELTVSVRGSKTLIDGTTYTAWAKQRVNIRFLLLSRQQEWS